MSCKFFLSVRIYVVRNHIYEWYIGKSANTKLLKLWTFWFSLSVAFSKVKAYIYTFSPILVNEWEDLWPILSITRFFIMQCNRHTYKCVQEYEIIFTHKRYLIITYDSIDEYMPAHTYTHVCTHLPYLAKHNLWSESWVHLIIWIFCNMSSVFQLYIVIYSRKSIRAHFRWLIIFG